jgi:hypothetical protein
MKDHGSIGRDDGVESARTIKQPSKGRRILVVVLVLCLSAKEGIDFVKTSTEISSLRRDHQVRPEPRNFSALKEEKNPAMVSLDSGYFIEPEAAGVGQDHSYGCVYNATGNPIPASRRFRDDLMWWKGYDVPPQLEAFTARLSSAKPLNVPVGARVLFGGFLNNHYGHFLIESLTRTWPLLLHRYDYVAMFCLDSLTISTIKGSSAACQDSRKVGMEAALRFLSRPLSSSSSPSSSQAPLPPPPKLLLINGTVFFSNITVDIPSSAWFTEASKFHPVASSIYRNIAHSASMLKQATASGAAPSVDGDDYTRKDHRLRVLFRRDVRNQNDHSSLGHKTVSNEVALAEMLSTKFGFVSVDPSTQSFMEQLNILSQAKIFAGRVGTGMHNAIFLPMDAHVVLLEDDRTTNHVQNKLIEAMNMTAAAVHTAPFCGEIVLASNVPQITFNLTCYEIYFNEMMSSVL